jgi:hypothetical protein
MNIATTDKPLITDILSAGSASDLRTLGTFAALKQSLQATLGSGIRTNSWANLYTFVCAFQDAATSDATPSARDSAKKRLSETLLKSLAGKPENVERDIDHDVSYAMTKLLSIARDPSVQYRITRSSNFVESSKLEGIDLRLGKVSTSLQRVINKHSKP